MIAYIFRANLQVYLGAPERTLATPSIRYVFAFDTLVRFVKLTWHVSLADSTEEKLKKIEAKIIEQAIWGCLIRLISQTS